MYYFIINPHSGNGKGYKICRKLERHLGKACVEYEIFLAKEPGEASLIARRLTEGCREPVTLVAVGGDGTVNEVLEGRCFHSSVTMGFIPAGTGNDLAKSLRIPENSGRSLKRILYPRNHKLLDYGVISYGKEEVFHRRFAVSAGIGLDGAVCHDMMYSFRGKPQLRFLRYLLIGIKQLLVARPAKGYLVLDGIQKVEFNHIYFVSVHIHPFEGGGFRFAPGADYSDGKLTLCVAHNSSKWGMIPALANAFIGRHKRYKGMRNYECREVEIHVDRPMAVHVDGESCQMQTEIQLRCIQKKLRMIV